MHSRLLLAAAFVPLLCAAKPQASVVPHSLSVHPSRVRLDGPRQRQQLVVMGEADGLRHDLTRAAKFTSDDPTVATVDSGGVIRSAGDGDTTVTVEAGGRKATVRVRVRQSE